MKLGRALATGVAEERPQTQTDDLELPEDVFEESEEIAEAAVPEEVPATR
ncbi:hypothetical protein ACYF6T_07450 [Streptomyces sp. 7R007]